MLRACYVHSISISHLTYHNLIKTSELQCLKPVNQKPIHHQYLSHSPVQSINQSINTMQEISYQPRPQGLLLVQNGGSPKPLGTPRLPKWLQRFVTMFSCQHDEMSFVSFEQRFSDCRKQTGPPDAGNHLRKSVLRVHVLRDKILHDSWSTVFPRLSARALF